MQTTIIMHKKTGTNNGKYTDKQRYVYIQTTVVYRQITVCIHTNNGKYTDKPVIMHAMTVIMHRNNVNYSYKQRQL